MWQHGSKRRYTWNSLVFHICRRGWCWRSKIDRQFSKSGLRPRNVLPFWSRCTSSLGSCALCHCRAANLPSIVTTCTVAICKSKMSSSSWWGSQRSASHNLLFRKSEIIQPWCFAYSTVMSRGVTQNQVFLQYFANIFVSHDITKDTPP